MEKIFELLSSDGVTAIKGVMWLPEEDYPRGVLQIVHGVTEYAKRYDAFAQYFVARGFAVVASDHLGHGESYCGEENKMHFDCWDFVVQDVKTVYQITKEEYPDVPYFMMGFSLGSFASRQFAYENPEALDGIIIAGTGYQPKLITKVMRWIVNREGEKIGLNQTSDFIMDLAFGTYNKQVECPKTEYDWLCSSLKDLKGYMNDPMVGKFVTAGLFREMLLGIEKTCDFENIKKMNKKLPVLMMSGSDDPVGSKTKGVMKVFNLFKKAGIENVKTIFYKNARHDIFNEGKHRRSVRKSIVGWMEANI